MVKKETLRSKSVKAGSELKVRFSIERNGETHYMHYYFRENDPHVFNKNDEDEMVKREYERFIEREKGEIAAWSVKESG